MKTNILFILIVCALSVTGTYAQTSTKATIKVYGNCIMCKERIEGALDKNGIKQASWNSKTKILDVVYNPKKISEQEIHKIVASVGHDTDKVKAVDTVYAELPFCCLYRDHDHESGNH